MAGPVYSPFTQSPAFDIFTIDLYTALKIYIIVIYFLNVTQLKHIKFSL
jgi:hypothetical protein